METINLSDFDFTGNRVKLNKEAPGIVLLYNERCPFCIEVKPVLEKYAKKKEGNRVYIMDDSGNENKEAFEKLGVQTVPDIRVLKKDGSLGDKYEGNREVEDFEKLVSTQTGGGRKRRSLTRRRRQKRRLQNRRKPVGEKTKKQRKRRKRRRMK
jgi:thiol-disulfide isomerase/thioredoxin